MRTISRESLLVCAGVLCILIVTSSGFDTSEGTYDYQIAKQWVTTGSLSFPPDKGDLFVVAPNGRAYGLHEIGNAVFLIPVAVLNTGLEAVLIHRVGPTTLRYVTGFFLPLVAAVYCALTVALVYALLRTVFDKPPVFALNTSLMFLFCSFVWTYSRNLFDGVLCMALLTGAVLALMVYRRTLDSKLFVTAVVLLGFGVITRLTMILGLVAACVYLVCAFSDDRRRLVWMAGWGTALLAPFAVWQMYYNHLRTGTVLYSPIQFESNTALTGDLLTGAVGLLFSPGKGVFVYLPIAVLSVMAFPRFRRSYPIEAVFVATLSLSWLLLHARLAAWWGAWGWGPRHFVTIAPVLALPALVCWESFSAGLLERSARAAVLVWGFTLAASSIISNWHFRMWLAALEGRDEATIWSLGRGQAVDMVTAAAGNIRHVLAGVPPQSIPRYSEVNVYASSSVNVWVNAAHHQGVPWPPLAAVVICLIAIAFVCLRAVHRSGPEGAV